MVDYNIQMKKSTNGKWNNLYPFNKTETVYDMKRKKHLDNVLDDIDVAMKEKINELTEQLKQQTNEIERILTEKVDENKKYIDKIKNTLPMLNVKDFGAVGDGVTDDTLAFQKAIDSTIGTRQRTIIVPPSEDKHYLISSLTIPSDCHILTLLGVGYAKLMFTENVQFKVKSEMFNPNNLVIQSSSKTAEKTGIVFRDDREYERLDFDIKITECTISYASDVVVTKGRGVEIFRSNFNNISHNIILTKIPPSYMVDPGQWDIQQYKTGVRGYIVKGCRFHYCTAIIIDNTSDSEKVLQGVQVVDNHIEGGLAYFWGFCRNGVFKNNIHYQAYTNRDSLFRFNDVDNVTIDVNVSGMDQQKDGYTKRISRLVEVLGKFTNLSVSGVLENCEKNVITLYKGGKGFRCTLVATDVYSSSAYEARFIEIAGGGYTYEGFYAGGSCDSNRSSNVLVHNSDGKNTIKQYKVDTLGIGSYLLIHNFEGY